jgi:signal transduction histidine kinase
MNSSVPSAESAPPFDSLHFDLLEEKLAAAAERAPAREGLPASFRMRHDAHYVDQLLAPRPVAQIRWIPVRDIKAPAANAAQEVAPLAAVIARFGLLQPLLVRGRGDEFELVVGARALAAAKLAGLKEVPCLIHELNDADAQAVGAAAEPPVVQDSTASPEPVTMLRGLRELCERLGGVDSCLDLIAAGDRPFRERVALELARIEAQRCTWLAQMLAVTFEEPFMARADVSVVALVERMLALLDAERRFSGVELSTEVPKGALVVRADQRLLSTALALAGAAVLALLAKVPEPRLRVRVHPDNARSAAVFELVQDQVEVPNWALRRWFDPEWTDRPGGTLVGSGLLGVRRIVELHSGQIGVTASPRGGCALTIAIPCC